MRLCPNCGADIEGLLRYCNCCGAEFDLVEKFIYCSIYEMPECLYFSSLIREMIDEIQPIDQSEFSDFLSWVGIGMVCYPSSIINNGNLKKHLRYYATEKRASMKLLVDYDSFVTANKNQKSNLIACELISGLEWLAKRMNKSGYNISSYVSFAKNKLNKYQSKTDGLREPF